MRNTFTLLLLTLAFFSCENPESDENPNLGPCESDAVVVSDVDHQTQAIKDFGAKLMQELTRSTDKNVIISPLSIYSALLLAQEAAACETRQQILRSLSLTRGNENISTAVEYNTLMEELNSEGPAICTYANALFHDPSRITIKEPYSNTLETYYNATSSTADFDQQESVDQINNWAADNTEDKITKVLDEISSDDIAFLLNAIHFKGDWENGFIENPGASLEFTLNDGTKIQVPSMFGSDTRAYHQDNDAEIVDMQIKGTEYAASFVLPTSGANVSELIQKEDFYSYYLDLLTQVEGTYMALSLPKFELKGNLSLKESMQALGMETAFIPGQADFSRMTDDDRAYITKILHDTYLKVDEKGIEGAAVTTVGVGITSVPPPVTFDRPFLLILRHLDSGVPIFMARVANPLDE